MKLTQSKDRKHDNRFRFSNLFSKPFNLKNIPKSGRAKASNNALAFSEQSKTTFKKNQILSFFDSDYLIMVTLSESRNLP